MNKRLYRSRFKRVWHTLVGAAKLCVGTLAGTEPSSGQIIAIPGAGAQVVQTQNGLAQVNIAKPSGAGVSLNHYSQFDVPKQGAILNNSPAITQTQQAGWINGNANLAPGGAARVIVNQVVSNAPSAIRGFVEVGGPRAEVVVANPNGLIVDGGGFINTSRAILTTGTPNFEPNGSLSGFTVNGGNIVVQGAGLNAANVDQVDLLARAIQVNAAIYANQLTAITGANGIEHDTLAATPVAGNGPAPAVALDVSALGGMYANRIFLASNEFGVGVSTRGVLAAQAGDLTLTSNGKLVLAGQSNASGTLNISARDGIDNRGTTYAQGDLVVATGGLLANSGVLAAQRHTRLRADSIASTGTLAAGVNGDGSLAHSGDLDVSAAGAVTVTGRNLAGGSAALSGSALDLGGSTLSAHRALVLTARSGDADFSGATITAGGSVKASAANALVNDHGELSATDIQLDAASLSNRNGKIVSSDALTGDVRGDLQNQGGTMQAAGAALVRAGSIDNGKGSITGSQIALAAAYVTNRGGAIAQTGTGTAALAVTNTLDNRGGSIASNGRVAVAAGAVVNASGSITARDSLAVTADGALDNADGKLLSNTDVNLVSGALNNDRGRIGAGANETIQTGRLTNSGGSIVAPTLTLTSTSTIDNSGGGIEANALDFSATDLINRAGRITQYGASATGFHVSGTFDNSQGGIFQTNSADLTFAPGTIINDGGSIIDAGTGTLTIAPGNGAGYFSNVGGRIIAAGTFTVQASGLNNANGVLAAQSALSARFAGDVDNTQGAIRALGSLSLASSGRLTNTNGQIQAGTGADVDLSTLELQAASVDNTGGLVSNLGTGDAVVQGGNGIVNGGGTMTANGRIAVESAALVNTQSAQLSGANVTVRADTVDNSGGGIGSVAGSNGDVAITTSGSITNTDGQIGATHDLTINAATLTGGGAYSAAHDVAVIVQGDFAPTTDFRFSSGHDLAFTLPGTFTNGVLLQAANNLDVNAADVRNSGTMMAGGTLSTHSNTLTNTGAIVGGSVLLNANGALRNLGPTALIGATDANGTLEPLAADIENRDDMTATVTQASTAIYGLGKVVLAGGKDANGEYTNAHLIRNQSALIESAGDMALYAALVTNTRTSMTTTGLNQPLDPALMEQLGISMSGCTAYYAAACSGQNVPWGSPPDPNAIGGAYVEPPHGGQWNSGYQYTTYTGVALANLIASISPKAQIIAGGSLDASHVGLLQNFWSAVAAASDIAAPSILDQNSWRGQSAPVVQVTYSGYYHYNNYDDSEHNWMLPFGDAPFVGGRPGGYAQVAPADIRTYALPAYESSFVAGRSLSGSGVSIDNTAANAGLPSIGLAPAQARSGVVISDLGARSGSRTIDSVIAGATAQSVLQNLTVPPGGLFSHASAPDATYLIVSNPAFTNQKSFISSDYFLRQLDLDPQKVQKRLGDGLYEQQLVRNQVTTLTGRAVLGPYTDTQAMYEALLTAGAWLVKSLDLPLGMSLSPEQVAALTSNVVIMQTVVIDGQAVLVPVVYLAKASQQNTNGPLIAATDIDLKDAQTFSNSGTIQAGNTLSIQGKQIDNAFGALRSGGLMSLTTQGDVDLTSATVNAGSLAVNAGGDLLLSTAVNTLHQVSATGATRTVSTLGPLATVNVAGDAAIVTGGDLQQNAGTLDVGGNFAMLIGGNYELGAVQTGEHKVVERANGLSNTNLSQTTGSALKVGGATQIGVGGDLTATGALMDLSGGGVLAANGNVTLQAARATSTVDSNSSGADGHGSYSESLHRSDDTLTATVLNAGNSLVVASGKDIIVSGSAINLDHGTAALAATGNVNLAAATETHVENTQEQHSHRNAVSGKDVASSRRSTATLAQGSMVSADAVTIASGRDINVKGSTIVATNDVALSAAHDVTIGTSQDKMTSSSSRQEKRSGLGTSGLTVTYGSNNHATTDHASGVTNNASTVGSLAGNLSIQAGNTLHVTGSDLIAAKDLVGMGANVTLDAAKDTAQRSRTETSHSSGLALGLSGSVGDAINNAYTQSHAASHSASTGNDRAATLHAIAAAGNAAMGVAGAIGGALMPNPSIAVQSSVGSNSSRSDSSETQTIHRGASVNAGGAAAFGATEENLNIAGSNVSASDVLLAAKNQVNVINTTDTASTRSSNSSKSASVGVSVGTNGFGMSAAMANAHGDANSDAAIQNASHVTGANSVAIVSGGDTNVIGSRIAGRRIAADVGGNLNIASVQDTTVSAAHQSSDGGGFTISQGGGGASFSAQNGHADGNYAQVKEQAGLVAGDGGFDVSVKGNTGLKGAVIAGADDAAKNDLSTGTLTFADVGNHSHYSASSIGGSVGLSPGPSSDKAVGPASVPGSGGLLPMIGQHENSDQNTTTRSAISPGTITLTAGDPQAQDIASLSRDTTNTNGTVANTPDLNAILNQQADTMQAAQAAGQVVAQGIGAYADVQHNMAEANHDQAAADAWDEGGHSRALLQAAGGALIGGLGGGSVSTAVGGAAGAGLASKMANQLYSLSKGVASETSSTLLGNLAANVAAAAGGALVGGTTGVATGTSVDLYNRQLHPNERQWANDNASKFAQFFKDQTGQTLTADQAQQMLLASGYRLVDATASAGPAPDGNKYATAFISQNGESMFRATPTEYNSPFLYSNADHSLSPEQQALPGHEAHLQVGIAAGGALAMVALGTIAPAVATGWAVNTLYDYGGDTFAYASGLSRDAPNTSKSLTVGFVAGLAGPAFLPLDTLGSGFGAKVAVGSYNGVLSGTAAFGGNAIAIPAGDPSANAATGATSYGAGTIAQTLMQGWAGNIANHIIQTFSGPTQTAIENAGKK
ncbi:hemagglutinin repeat-containing protein [Caballeronia sp. LZ035]|uniref:two-partner secretion domain-containing protein n=1 Tax=Caballeronia sp. LZ035 TaxID=3038568 RepID=UPI0028552055|nr:hemagglutinin repeat-containing protein [Caballeronia sp. LZ035]MDR5762501.1 hemagglutinin repeat-containing protein [Caballeronia sp. LZ035]